MKITRRDLDSEIIEKLDQLDKIVNTYDSSTNPDGFISYGPNGFYFKKTNDTFLKRVYTEDEIVGMENSLESTNRNITSSLITDIRLDNKLNSAARKFLYNAPFTYSKEFSSKIVLSRELSDSIVLLTKDGELIKFGKELYTFKLLESLESNFNLANQILINDIVDISELDNDTLIIATSSFGIYKLQLSTNELEMVCSIDGVKAAKVTHTGTLFVASNYECSFFDIPSGKKIEKYMTLFNNRQLPKDVILTETGIFVIAVPTGIQTTDSLIHFWKLDPAKVSYNLADSAVDVHSLDNNYQILFSSVDKENLYLAGKLRDVLFVWKYNIKTLTLTEDIIDCVKINTFDGFMALNGFYLIISDKILYIIKSNKLEGKLSLNNRCFNLMLHSGELTTYFDNTLVKFALPQFETKVDNLSYKIFDGNEECNNIDIFVKNAGRRERIVFIDMTTNKEISPAYYIVYNGNSVIKLMNCKALKIKMIISVTPETSLGGIVIKNNRMFLR